MSRSDMLVNLLRRSKREIQRIICIAITFSCATMALAAVQVDYTYDALGRLKTVSYSDGPLVYYDYDPAGNRTQQIVQNLAPNFSVNDVSVSEGGALTFTVTKTGTTILTHDVNYGTATGTADSTDFTAKSGTVTFAPSETTKTVSVVTIEDAVHENDESLYLNLSSATNGATISDSQGVGTVTNNDAGPSFAINDVTAEEGNNLTFTVTKSGATAKSHNVNYATANGTATAGSDYTTKSGALSFTSGQASKTVTITGIEDSTFEPNETFYVNLSSATAGATISDSQGVGTVTNDDVANSPPNALNDSTTFQNIGTDKTVYVLNNDSDPDGDPLTIIAVTQPSNAWVTINQSPAGTLNVLSFSVGNRSFTYTVSDGNGGTDTATVTVTVNGGGMPW